METNLTIMVVVAFLTNGTPLPNFFILDGVACNREAAIDYTKRLIVPSLAEGFQIQDPTREENLFVECVPVPGGPGPGPAMYQKPMLLPGQTDA